MIISECEDAFSSESDGDGCFKSDDSNCSLPVDPFSVEYDADLKFESDSHISFKFDELNRLSSDDHFDSVCGNGPRSNSDHHVRMNSDDLGGS